MNIKKLFKIKIKNECFHANLTFAPIDFNGGGFYTCPDCNKEWAPFIGNKEPLTIKHENE